MAVVVLILVLLALFDLALHAYIDAGLVLLICAAFCVRAKQIIKRRSNSKETDQ
jgi:hypothetical protein